MWPVNVAKPLISRLNVMPARDPHADENTKENTLEDPCRHKPIAFPTPKSSKQIYALTREVFLSGHNKVARSLFRSIGKGYDKTAIELALAKDRIKMLEAQIELLRPIRKKQVRPNPNDTFINIEQVQRAQKHYRKVLDAEMISEAVLLAQFDACCFEFQLEVPASTNTHNRYLFFQILD